MDKLLSVVEAAERAGVCPTLMYGWVGNGELPCYRLGAAGKRGKIAIAEADLEAFLQARKVARRREAAPAAATPVVAQVQTSIFRFLPPS